MEAKIFDSALAAIRKKLATITLPRYVINLVLGHLPWILAKIGPIIFEHVRVDCNDHNFALQGHLKSVFRNHGHLLESVAARGAMHHLRLLETLSSGKLISHVIHLVRHIIKVILIILIVVDIVKAVAG